AQCQRAPDPLGPPALQRTLVLGEQAGVAGIVDIALLTQHLDRVLHGAVLDPLAGEVPAHLALGAVATVQVPVGELERVRHCRQAAWPAASGSTAWRPGSSRDSIGVMLPRPIPSAA